MLIVNKNGFVESGKEDFSVKSLQTGPFLSYLPMYSWIESSLSNRELR